SCPSMFTPGGPVSDEILQAAQWLKQKGFKKVGILEEEEAFAETETQPLIADLENAGVATTTATFNPTALDVQPQISELKSAGAQAIFVEALAGAAGYAATGRTALGFQSTPLVFDI